jgi:hypothetical protein
LIGIEALDHATICSLLGGDIPVFCSRGFLYLPAEELGVEFPGPFSFIIENLEVDYSRHKDTSHALRVQVGS